MSSPSTNQFNVQSSPIPQSAQPYPYQSIFGGPSSQDVNAQSQSYRQLPTGTAEVENDLDMEEQLIDGIVDQSASDDGTYQASDEDAILSESAKTGSRRHATKVGMRSTISHVQRNKNSHLSPSSSPSPSMPPHAHRLNRFQGSEATWWRITLEERQNAQALETIRARDLAAHLYNAYALRVRAREIAKRTLKGKNADKLRNEDQPFAPPKRWTAWPMPAREVPRADEALRREEDDVWTLRRPPDMRPSAELEESLIAIMLKTAKEKFEERDWDEPEGGRSTSVLRRRKGVDIDHHESTDDERHYKSDPESADEVSLRPVTQADDEKSRQQLQPLTRRIISQVDQLLLSLHHTRKNDLSLPVESSATEGQTDTTDTDSQLSDASRSRRRVHVKTKKSQSRSRKRRRISKIRVNDDSSKFSASNVPSAADLQPSRHLAKFGLRDWSQVLGLASMVGLPSDAVMRAAKRCSDLFHEDMEFGTFKEGKMSQVKKNEGPPVWVYSESESQDGDDEDRHEREPIPSASPSPRLSRSQSRGRPRLRPKSLEVDSSAANRATSTSAPGTSPIPPPPSSPPMNSFLAVYIPDDSPVPEPESQRDESISAATSKGGRVKNKGKGEHRKQDLVCPIKGCQRHKKGFSRTWNLNLHLKRVHPGYIQRSQSAQASVASPVNVSSDDEMNA